MKVPLWLVVLLIVVTVGVSAWWFRHPEDQPHLLSLAGSSDVPKFNTFPRTEESWSIKEICDTIAMMLVRPAYGKSDDGRKILARLDDASAGNYMIVEGTFRGTVKLSTSVWDPATYQGWCAAVGQKPPVESSSDRPDILQELLNPDTETLLKMETRLSQELQEHPGRADAHVDSALLLGVLAWTENAGHFEDIRSLLNRMTAQLAVADFLGARSDARDTAEILRFVLIHDQTAALGKIKLARSGSRKIPDSLLDALEVASDNQWKKMEARALHGAPILQMMYFRSVALSAGPDKAVEFFKSVSLTQQGNPFWYRAANLCDLGVNSGHQFSSDILSVETEDSLKVVRSYEPLMLAFGTDKTNLSALLNFLQKYEGKACWEYPVDNRIIGKQLWAAYLERHFLQGARVLHGFLADSLGTPEEAEQAMAFFREHLGKLYYYPFLIREAGKKPDEQEAARILCERMLRDRPESIGPELWSTVVSEKYQPIANNAPDFHLFFHPEIPRQTSFEAGKRLHEIGVGDENDVPFIKSLLIRSPWDYELANHMAVLEAGMGDKEVSMEKYFTPFEGNNADALRWLASFCRDNPSKWESYELQLAAISPASYIDLAWYFEERGDVERTQKYYELAHPLVDSVRFANNCGWLVNHYYDTGRFAEAETLAEECADAYSYNGLEIFGRFKERLDQWDKAFETFQKIDSRYNDDKPVAVTAHLMRKQLAGKKLSNSELALCARCFPNGLQRNKLSDFGTAAPTSGIIFTSSNSALEAAGLGAHVVVVELDGVRVDSKEQYLAMQQSTENPEMDFIFWDGERYIERKARVWKRRFGLNLNTFAP